MVEWCVLWVTDGEPLNFNVWVVCHWILLRSLIVFGVITKIALNFLLTCDLIRQWRILQLSLLVDISPQLLTNYWSCKSLWIHNLRKIFHQGPSHSIVDPVQVELSKPSFHHSLNSSESGRTVRSYGRTVRGTLANEFINLPCHKINVRKLFFVRPNWEYSHFVSDGDSIKNFGSIQTLYRKYKIREFFPKNKFHMQCILCILRNKV